jgi:hypothetical protein
MMYFEQEGISPKSFAISMGFTVAGIVAMLICLNVAKFTPDWLQGIEAIGTLGLFAVGGAAWMGKFDKNEPRQIVVPRRPRDDWAEVEEQPVKKSKPVPKEDWAAKWLKENK